MAERLRVVYAGTPAFAVPALEQLVAAGHEVAAVYTQPDRAAGRGRRLQASPVKTAALSHGLPVRQPETLRDANEQAALAALVPDVMVVAAYGQILPRAVLAAPAHGCLNIHASLLPRWRGAAPIQRAMLAGDAETGVSLMVMEPGLDTGPVVATRRCAVGPDDTAGSLHERLAALGGELMHAPLRDYIGGRAVPVAQPEAGVTHAPKLDKAEACIDWNESADVIARKVRAFDPWPVAYTAMPGGPLRLWRAHVAGVEQAGNTAPGTVVGAGEAGLDVATGGGVLRVTELQPAGRKRQPAAAFVRGRGVRAGERLGS